MFQIKERNKGQGMVEFALVFPLLLVVTLGIIQFGWMMFSYSAVVTSSREGARYGAAIQDVGGGISQYEDCQGIKEAAKRIGGLVGVDDDDISIQYSNDGGIYALSCPPSQDVHLSDQIIVTVQKEIRPLVPFIKIPPLPVHSTASHTILKEVEVGESGTGSGSVSGALTDVNFKTTSQTAEETKGTISVDVILNQVTGNDVTVPFSITGTATEGTDYTITSSPVIIPAGSQSATIYITLINDGIEEGSETLVLGLDTPTNATKGPQDIHTVTIVDPPKVSFSLASQSRSEGINEVAIEVVLSKGSSQDVTVPYTKGGDAEWGSTKDYTNSPSEVFFPSGTTSKTIFIHINDDLIDEYDEDLILTLGLPTNALLGSQKTHTLTILDNDDPPQVTFFTSTISISEEVGTLMTYVELSNISGKEITLPYALSGTATSEDYVIMSPSPITIPAGDWTAGIYFSISEGDGMEEDETLIIDLENPTNATIGAIGTQTVIITEDTVEPTISFTQSASGAQENEGSQKVFVEMSNGWTDNVTVNYSVTGTADRGSSGDYTLSPQPLVIPKGKVRQEIDIELLDDITDEDDETIILTLDSVSVGTLGSLDTHTFTIYDDDSQPEVSFEKSSQTKMETAGNVSVHISLSAPSTKDITIPLTYSGTATIGEDYNATVTDVIVPGGVTSATFTVDLIDDSEYDPGESILISMGSPINGVLGGITEHEINITDDELPPCKVESNLLSVGTTNLTWNLVNKGEEVVFTGGSVTWPEASVNKPRLNTIYFGGSEVYSGNDKPGTLSYTANELFSSGSYIDLSVMFSDELGSGDHSLVAHFQNPLSGEVCSTTILYSKP
ncbi:MAG: Calx-beta domain-containing protein [Anaerolineales bacterium]